MNAPTPKTAALAGIRILDLTSIVFGPYASQILADYGAEVIKIESPEGDSTRNTGPRHEQGMSAIFLGVNRNKKSVCLNLKDAQAREALLKLVDTADVFMHSVRPQKMAALGLDQETLLQRNPRLVYAGLHGFGNGGAYAGQPAYDDIIQGLSGVADLMTMQTGTPRYLPIIAADKNCGVAAAHAILAALFQRERTGEGQFVEIPMFETMTAYVSGGTPLRTPPARQVGRNRLPPGPDRVAQALPDSGWLRLHDAVHRQALADLFQCIRPSRACE